VRYSDQRPSGYRPTSRRCLRANECDGFEDEGLPRLEARTRPGSRVVVVTARATARLWRQGG